MARLGDEDGDSGGGFWADLIARLLGVLAALALMVLGVTLLFPASSMAAHLPALSLGPIEPQRPLVGLLSFALAGVVGAAIMLRREDEPLRPQPASRPRPAQQGGAAPQPLDPFPAREPPASLPALTLVPARETAAPQLTPLDFHDPGAVAEPAAPVAEETEAQVAETPSPAPEPSAPTPEAVSAGRPPAAEPDFDNRRLRLKAAFGEASALATGLAASATNDHQRALAAQDMGDIAAAGGGHDQAADAYDRALLHARDLAAAHPGALPVKAVLADVLVKIGDLNLRRGRLAAAIGAYEEAVARRREVALVSAAQKPRLDLAAAVDRLAQARLSRGDRAGARTLYEESLADLAPIVADDPHYADLVYRARTQAAALRG